MRKIIQFTYIFTFLFAMLGIVGNMELDVPTPLFWKVVAVITGFLTIGKFIYLDLEEGR